MPEAEEKIVHGALDALVPFLVPIADLTIDPANAMTHPEKNRDGVRDSLKLFGQRQLIVVQREGMIVRAGNCRVEEAKKLGWTHVAALVVDENDVEATAYAIADNRTGQLGVFDDRALARVLQALGKEAENLIVGFDDSELKRYLEKWEDREVEFTAHGGEPEDGEEFPALDLDATKHTCPECGHEF